jgi:hypothetical protein
MRRKFIKNRHSTRYNLMKILKLYEIAFILCR